MNGWSWKSRRARPAIIALAVLSVAGIVIPVTAQKRTRADLAPLDQPIAGAVATVGPEAGPVSYRITVPDDAFELSVVISNAPADLDIVVYGEGGELLTFSELSMYNESLTLSRLGDPALPTGPLDVEITYQYSRPPVVDGVELTEIPFTLEFQVARLASEGNLRLGQATRGTLTPDEGMADVYRVEVPTGTNALRVDVSDTDGDLDLFVSRDAPPVVPYEADHLSQSIRSTETLVIDRESSPPLRPGSYYVLVLDQLSSSFATDYTLSIHDDATPPPVLSAAVEIPRAETELERAILATVELLTNSGGGSGVLVDPRGYLLTNWHVVQADSGAAEEDITVGFSTDPGIPAEETFRAEVVTSAPDRDLALLQIVSGRYGQPLPAGARFPFLQMRESVITVGEDLRFLGYPWIGGTGSRATITFTRGTVAGFQTVPFGRLIKTDGVINEGSSGGAAIDNSLRLVGLPTEVVGFDGSQIAYIYPVTAIPDDWFELLRP